MKKKRKLTIALLCAAVAFGYIVYQATINGQGYYLKPSELIARARTDGSLEGSRLRVTGSIIDGSVKPRRAAKIIRFKLTDAGRAHQNRAGGAPDARRAGILKVVYAGTHLPTDLRTDLTVMVEGTYIGGGALKADDIFNWFFSMSASDANGVR